jgi:hypothetical protein
MAGNSGLVRTLAKPEQPQSLFGLVAIGKIGRSKIITFFHDTSEFRPATKRTSK